ncbi:MAG: DUF1993 domain-containing protein [Dokdonella sp.]
MSHLMYQASVPVFVRTLTNLAEILRKAATHAQAKKIDPAVLVSARLFPDMLPLSRQIQIASDHAKNASSRLTGVERPSFDDNETTFDELQARIAKTIAYVQTIDAAKFDGSDQRDISIPIRGTDAHLKGQDYLFGFVHPNFYFHVTTAYAILRQSGVEIGKTDFIGTLPT